MKTAVIIVEADVLEKPLYFGKSGDLAIIDFFLRKNWKTVLVNANEMQYSVPTQGFAVKPRDYSNTFYHSMLNECNNIANGKTPATNAENLGIQLEFEQINLNDCSDCLLISRAMPQSINSVFLANFNALAKNAKYAPQNMVEINLYKDKAIPYLLQNNSENLEMLYTLYHAKCKDFKNQIGNSLEELSLNTIALNVNQSFEENSKHISHITGKVCVKPFNLFGGVGVKVFDSINQKVEIQEHIQKIDEYFTQYNVREQRLALVQEAVSHPEFGDVRALFSLGKFLGAFKRFEEYGQIHNTMYGGIIIPICNSKMQFHSSFETKYRKPFTEAIKQLEKLNTLSQFLQNEFICGYDLLLTENKGFIQFKLTESNLPCPTGFPFLDCSLISFQNKQLDLNTVKTYFTHNERTVDVVMENLLDSAK